MNLKYLSMVLFISLVASLSAGAATVKAKTLKPAKKAVKEEVRCPVTGNKVDPAKAYAKTVYKGKTYYFCCGGCPEEFKSNPGKYAK
jgi:Cu+-exporting ATPase